MLKKENQNSQANNYIIENFSEHHLDDVMDIEIHANEVLSLKKRLNEIYSMHTGKSVDEIKSALERDNFMTADFAKSFGLIDEVVEKRY